MMRSAALIETHTGGHRLWYVRLLIDRLARMSEINGVAVHLPVGAESTPEWQVHLANSHDFILHEIPANLNRHDLLRSAAAGASFVILPDGDQWLPIVARSSGLTDTALLLTRPFPGNEPRQRLRWGAKMGLAHAAASRRAVRILRLGMTEHTKNPHARLRWVPDPVHLASQATRLQARRELGLEGAANVSLMCGGLSRRKGVDLICAAWRQVKDADARLVCVGAYDSPEILTSLRDLAAEDDRVVLRLGYVSNLEFDTWIIAADRTLNLYDNVGSSGVALKSWATGTAVVAVQGGYVAQRLHELGARLHVVPSDDQGCLGAVLAGRAPASAGRVPSHAEVNARTSAFVADLIGSP